MNGCKLHFQCNFGKSEDYDIHTFWYVQIHDTFVGIKNIKSPHSRIWVFHSWVWVFSSTATGSLLVKNKPLFLSPVSPDIFMYCIFLMCAFFCSDCSNSGDNSKTLNSHKIIPPQSTTTFSLLKIILVLFEFYRRLQRFYIFLSFLNWINSLQ